MVWRETEQFKRIIFRHVEVYNKWEVDDAKKWPDSAADLRWIVPRMGEKMNRASPRFFIVENNDIVLTASGNGWVSYIKPWIDERVGV